MKLKEAQNLETFVAILMLIVVQVAAGTFGSTVGYFITPFLCVGYWFLVRYLRRRIE